MINSENIIKKYIKRVNKIVALTFFLYPSKMLFSLFILVYRHKAPDARYTGKESILDSRLRGNDNL